MRQKIKSALYDNTFSRYIARKINAFLASQKTLFSHFGDFEEKSKFVVIIPSYNAETFCKKNLNSVLEQRYNNYRIVYIDDCSTDETANAASEILHSHLPPSRFVVQRNRKNQGALANLYTAIHSCCDDEIVIALDGDDWLAHEWVLPLLNAAYAKEDTWMTYGQYIEYPSYTLGCCEPLPKQLLAKKNCSGIRSYKWVTSHLRSFYAFLFKKIAAKDLFWQGEFSRVSWDFAMMLPMIEMAGTRVKYISDVLYIYNNEQPLNDHRLRPKAQQEAEKHFRSLAPYASLPPQLSHLCRPIAK